MSKNKWSSAIEGGGDSIRRFKIPAPESGEVTKKRVRIIRDNFEDVWAHFFPGYSDKGERAVRYAVCLGRKKCPICKKLEETGDEDYKAKRYFYINVFDRKDSDSKVKLWQASYGIFKQIAEIADEDDGLGNLSEYDIVIKRKGSKKNDTRYTVKPFMKDGQVVKKKLPKELVDISELPEEDGGCYALEKFSEKKSYEELEAMLTGDFEKSDEDDDEDKKKKKKSKDEDEDEDEEEKEEKKERKKRKKKDDEDEEEEEEDKKKKKKKDDEDEEEEEDEDEDKKKKKKKDEDEDEDEDDDEDDKKKKKSKKDEDDDEDLDDDDLDD